MEDRELEYSLKGIERLYPDSYRKFRDKGEEAVYILEDGVEEAPNFASTDEIYDEGYYNDLYKGGMNRNEFTVIVNLLSRAKVIPTWNSSSPFKISTEDYSMEEVVEAYEYVSEEPFRERPENPILDEESLYKV